MNIQEFRQKYPEYDSVDDNTLSERLYEKHYKDQGVDYADFQQRFIGQPAQEKKNALPFKIGIDNPGGQSASALEQMTQQGPPTVFGSAPYDIGRTAAKNTPDSAMRLGNDLITAVTNPVETAKGIGNIVVGAGQKLVPGEQGKEPYADAVAKFYSERYGSLDKLKESFMQDPVGVLVDFAGATALAGKTTQLAGKAAKIQGLADFGKAGVQVGTAVDPMRAITAPIGAVGKSVLSGTPEKMYQSSAKFSTTIPERDRTKLARTALDERVMPTLQGVDKTRSLIDDLNTQIATKIDNAVQNGQTIQIDDLFTHFDELRKDAYLTGTPTKNINAINKVERDIRLANEALGRGELTAKQAQKLKQNIYRDLNTQYGKASVPASAQAQKAVARAAKEQIELVHPEIKSLNAKEGDLIKLLQAIEKSSSRIANRDMAGIGVPIKTGAGAAVGGDAGAMVGFVQGILDSPLVKARLAIVVDGIKNGRYTKNMTVERGIMAQEGRLRNHGVLDTIPSH